MSKIGNVLAQCVANPWQFIAANDVAEAGSRLAGLAIRHVLIVTVQEISHDVQIKDSIMCG